MENQSTPSSEPGTDLDNFFNLSFDTAGLDTLRQLSLWAKIISICAFIGYVFALAAALFGHSKSLDEGSSSVTFSRTSNLLGTFLTVIIGGAINYFLYRFAVGIDRGVKSMDALKVNEGFNSLRIYFKILGIILIIVLAILVLAILIGLAGLAGR
ncbi:MAG TPA: hypothetical protein VMH27_12425 [Puia sp.]|nr:hypothetical protein [Puia sp.]